MSIFKKKQKVKEVVCTKEVFDPETYFEELYQEKVLEMEEKKKWVDENINKFQFLEKYNITVGRNEKEIIIRGKEIYPYEYSYYISKPSNSKQEFKVLVQKNDVRWYELKEDIHYDWTLKGLLSSIFLTFDIEKKENV